MATLGEITIIFDTDDFENAEEARKYLHKDLLVLINSFYVSATGRKGKFKALDVIELEVYDDVVYD
jgi:hypothetical protein